MLKKKVKNKSNNMRTKYLQTPERVRTVKFFVHFLNVIFYPIFLKRFFWTRKKIVSVRAIRNLLLNVLNIFFCEPFLERQIQKEFILNSLRKSGFFIENDFFIAIQHVKNNNNGKTTTWGVLTTRSVSYGSQQPEILLNFHFSNTIKFPAERF